MDGASNTLGAGQGQEVAVVYHLELDGLDARWGVRHIDLHEQLSGLYECEVHALCSDSHPEVRELLAVEAHLQIERGEQMRTVHGIVKHAVVTEHESGSLILLHIVPAMWLLDQNMRSRVFTNETIPEVVEAIYQERLGRRNRTVRNDLTRTYPTHELLIQHQETDLAFIQRRLEEEGIFTYFVHDGDHEELVLADVNSNLANAREDDSGRVHWCDPQRPGPDGEGVTQAFHYEHVGAHDVVVTEYNWTAPDAVILGERTEPGEFDPPLEVYDHTDALALHSYDGSRYSENDATDQARMRAEILDLRRQRWELSSLIVAARPGHVLELVGCPDGDLDGRYVIVSVSGEGSATEGRSGEYRNELTVIPRDVPFRPARRTPVPLLSGYQSAMVVGPSDQEIHTDEHGRVRIRFPWDREHEPSDYDRCSCWVRVMHSWAGPGFGTTFIPRIGMEVVVSFLNGNPDRPLVVGCLYHGKNPVPYELPLHKTRSTIKTNSSVGGDGYNELRFEDKKGSEEIFIHAEKDFNEVVKNCHTTRVGVDQSNTVDRDHTELVKGEQELTVENSRRKTIEADETNRIKGTRNTTVGETGGDEILRVVHNRTEQIEGDSDTLTVTTGNKATSVSAGKWNITTKGEFKVVQNSINELYMQDCLFGAVIGRIQWKAGGGVHYDAMPGGRLTIKNTGKLFMESEDDQLYKSKGKIKMTSDQKITISADAEIVLECGGSKIKLTPSGIEISGPEIKINATSGITDITAASQVKIKC